MPRYLVRCACGATQETYASYATFDAEYAGGFVITCPACGATGPHAVVPGQELAVQFKGPGFYRTDARDEHERYLFTHFDKSG